jgi:hypothetical protein
VIQTHWKDRLFDSRERERYRKSEKNSEADAFYL